MGQVGLHALTGLAFGTALANAYPDRDREDRRALMFSFVLGNILPDLDFLAVVGMFPVDQALALDLHRGFSHSLLAAVALSVGFAIAAILMRDDYLRYMGYGLAVGTLVHAVEDIFLWFAPVDLFWPASVYGLIPPIDIWSDWWTTPVLIGRLMGAAEFAAFALYYDFLVRLALQFRTDRSVVPSAHRMATICWIVWALLTALSFDLPAATFDLYFYLPMGVVFMPSCVYLTWRMQQTIETLSLAHQLE